MTRTEALKLATVLRAAFPRQKLPEDTLEVYAELLGDLDFGVAKMAVMTLARTVDFFPSIAEIRNAVADIVSPRKLPEEAWGEVQQAIGRIGAYRTPVFEDADTQRAVEIIGWQNVCLDENAAATRARFIDAYRGLAERTQQRIALGQPLPVREIPEKTTADHNGFLETGAPVFAGKAFQASKAIAGAGGGLAVAGLVGGVAKKLTRGSYGSESKSNTGRGSENS